MTTIEARPSEQLTTALPPPRGPLSESVVEYVTGRSARLWAQRGEAPLDDPDAQLALWLLHCLDVAVDWDVDPERARAVPLQLLHLHLSRSFEAEVQRLIPAARGRVDDLAGRLDQLVRSPAIDLAGTAEELSPDAQREAFAAEAPHRGFEDHAHTMAMARLEAPLQRIVAELQAGRLGVGREQTRAQSYRGRLTALGVTYTDAVATAPTAALALANLAWLFGREVRWRGAAVGQICLLEVDPVTADPRLTRVVREQLVPAVQARTPWLAADAAFGAEATWTMRQRVATELVTRWQT